MASAKNLIDRFQLEIELEKKKVPLGLLVDWLDQSQLDFVETTEMLQDIWSPSVSTSIALPTDFLREFAVKIDTTPIVALKEIDYTTAILDTILSGSSGLGSHYSKFNNKFYIWPTQSTAVNLIVPYLKKPTAVTLSNFETADLEIPTEFHEHLLSFLFGRFYAKSGDKDKEIKWKTQFEVEKIQARTRFDSRRYQNQEIEPFWL